VNPWLVVKALFWGAVAVRGLKQTPKSFREARTLYRQGKVEAKLKAERQARISAGEIPPDFKGYDDYIVSDWWRSLRAHTLDYLGHACEFCGARATQVHHVRYPKPGSWGRESIKSLCAVCSKCHDVAHGLDAEHGSRGCAFCEAPATHELKIALQKHTSAVQKVCRRCEALAMGYRGQSRGWPQAKYDAWAERWRATFRSSAKG
jgi:hypothetical protein